MNAREINLTPAELKAVEDHKYYLSQECGAEVSVEEAVADFLQRFADDWRREKLRRDNLEQRLEIEKHKYFRSKETGCDIGKAIAAQEWCEKYAHIWRAERESLERNGFVRLSVVVKNAHELHMRPMSSISKIATEHDCDVYVHKDGMVYWNFLLEGQPFMNVKSIVGFLSMGVTVGDTLEFIATGAQAREALDSLAKLMSRLEDTLKA
ncbi:MAG: HPr family phosphocarrier protein [Verrucomicrobia bacterium]|nr:HPr family phosphocarrier protein [Verrucomicrobiota bacterium]